MFFLGSSFYGTGLILATLLIGGKLIPHSFAIHSDSIIVPVANYERLVSSLGRIKSEKLRSIYLNSKTPSAFIVHSRTSRQVRRQMNDFGYGFRTDPIGTTCAIDGL